MRRSENIFVKDFLQLTFNSLTFFLTWHRCIIMLTFPKNIFYFHTAISQTIELKINVCKNYTFYLRPVYRDIRSSLKTCAIEQVLLNKNRFKVNYEYTKTRCEISPNLTIKRTPPTLFLGVYCSFWMNFNAFFNC